MPDLEDINATAFKIWLAENKGYFNPKARFNKTASGFSIIANESLPSDSTAVKTPFSLAITRESAYTALSKLLNQSSAAFETWNERQCIACYLCFHLILDGESPGSNLRHHPYVKILPSFDKLRTGLVLTAQERELFKGTNLYGAILDRERDWRLEWSECQRFVAGANEEWGRAFTWEIYLTTASHLSSRAFPSALLSRNPSLQSSSAGESVPVLLPGIDSFNHARGQPVSWVVTYPDETNNIPEPCLSLVIHNPASAGSELFNNYGLKANAELILGYGFSLPENPDDTILLKIGGRDSRTGPKKWEIGREAQGAEGLWTEVLSLVASNQEEEITYEDELDASSMLGEMVQVVIDKLPQPRTRSLDPAQIRPEVVEMFHNYVQGQQAILDSLLVFVNTKEQAAIEKAKMQGVEIVLED